MRLPRFRFTVRAMMVAVAIVGLYLSYLVLLSRLSVMEYVIAEKRPLCTPDDYGCDTPLGYGLRVAVWMILPPVALGFLVWLPFAVDQADRWFRRSHRYTVRGLMIAVALIGGWLGSSRAAALPPARSHHQPRGPGAAPLKRIGPQPPAVPFPRPSPFPRLKSTIGPTISLQWPCSPVSVRSRF